MVLQKLCQKASTIVGMRGVACFSLGVADDRLHLRSIFHLRCLDVPEGLSIPLDGSSDFSVAAAGAMTSGECLSCDTTVSLGPLTVSGPSIMAPIVWTRAPIEEDEEPKQRPIGVMLFWGPRAGQITETDLNMAANYAKQSSSLLVEERLIEVDGATLAFATVPVALILLDREDRILLVNPMAERVLNGELTPNADVCTIDRACQLGSMVHRARQSPEGASSSSFTAFTGETFSATAQVAKDGDCVISLAKIHVSNSAEQMIGQVAHELRTPLTVIQGNIQTLEIMAEVGFAGEDMPIVQEMIAGAISQCSRMTRMIAETLNVARIQAGKPVEIKRANFDLSEATKGLLRELGDYLSTHLLEFDIAPKLMVDADQDKMISVLDNLLKNAKKYSPEGSTISLRVTEHDGFLEISVTDQGIGVPADAIERIGREPGFRTDQSRMQADGIGLGMVYVRRVVEGHGGTLSITSELGKGSRFTATIPLGEVYQT